MYLLIAVVALLPSLYTVVTAQQSPFAAEYDFIIVGGGTAGLVLASRLSETNQTVLVLEAGPSPDDYGAYKAPLELEFVLNQPIDWSFVTTPQNALNGRSLVYHRGRCLGGSSTINGMAYVRGSAELYHSWAALGNNGWAWEDVEPYFKKSTTFYNTTTNLENFTNYDPSVYGTGPLAVSFGGWDPSSSVSFIQGGPSIDIPIVNDLNNGSGLGVKQGTVTVDQDLQRSCAYTAYYQPVQNRTNLLVRPLAQVLQLIVTETNGTVSANGVAFFDQKSSAEYVAMARKEVILSAGAFQSPQILMTAGIGPSATLQATGIQVLVDNENVGMNLQDSQIFSIYLQATNGSSLNLLSNSATMLEQAEEEYLANRTGPFTNPGGFTNAFQQLSAATLSSLGATTIINQNRTEQAHIQYSYTASFYPSGLMGQYFPKTNEDYFAISVTLAAPSSRGKISISSNSMQNPPVIDLNFYNTTEDVNLAIYGFNETRKLLASPAFQSVTVGSDGGEVAPGPSVQSDDDIMQWIRNDTVPNWHACGTCAMKPEAEGGVVDERLRVYGVTGLRVVDASIFPLIPDANIQAAVYMTAEKAADLIKEDWKL